MGYGYNGYTYESVPVEEDASFFQFRYYVYEGNDKVFLRIVRRQGRLTYYHWEYLDEESNYLNYIPLFHKTGNSEMVRVTQGILGLKRKRLANYFAECPGLGDALMLDELHRIHEVFEFYIRHCGQ
jgi:hypothetical protein